MNVLLTGATGFLGQHLLPKLLTEGYGVILLKRSFSSTSGIENLLPEVTCYDIDKTDIGDIFSKSRVDTIIHLATDYGKKKDSHISRMVDVNIKFPSTLLDSGIKGTVKTFINTDTYTDSSYLLYSATKKAFIKIAEFYSSQQHIKFINTKLHTVYGERDDFSKFIPFAIKSILRGDRIEATGGMQKRDFIYVSDVVRALMDLLSRIDAFPEYFTEIEIGTGECISLRELVGKIEEVTGKQAIISWDSIPYRKNEDFERRANISSAKRLLGWSPQVPIEEGLLRTVSWYAERL